MDNVSCSRLQNEDDTRSVFYKVNNLSNLQAQIKLNASSKILKSDRLPQQISAICRKTIGAALEFGKQSTEADIILVQRCRDSDTTQVVSEYCRYKNSQGAKGLSFGAKRKSKRTTIPHNRLKYKNCVSCLARNSLKSRVTVSEMNTTAGFQSDQPNEQIIETKGPVYGWETEGSFPIASESTGNIESVNYIVRNDPNLRKEQEMNISLESPVPETYGDQRDDTFQSLSHRTLNRVNTSAERRVFTCEKCNKTYLSKTALLKHRESHAAEKTCQVCGESFSNSEKLAEHSRKHKDPSEFKCEVCSKLFMDQAKLNSHLRVHGKGPPIKMDKLFLCDICSKTFASRTGLGFHLRTHTGYKPYTCQYCNKGFTISSNKIRHERTHTGDKHFICHFCSAAFASSNGLKYHLTMHTGETNYHCKTCGKSFTRLKYLKEHNFIHTGEKPFVCKICGASYGNSGSLFAHEKKCKAQYGTCLAGINRYSTKETEYMKNQEDNEILYSKMHEQPQVELQTTCSQDDGFLLPAQNQCPPEMHHQTNHHLVPSISSYHVKWSDAI